MQKPFYFVSQDEDQKLCNVLGPLINDTELSSAVVQAKESGRHMRYTNVFEEDTSRQKLENNCKQSGYTITKTILC